MLRLLTCVLILSLSQTTYAFNEGREYRRTQIESSKDSNAKKTPERTDAFKEEEPQATPSVQKPKRTSRKPSRSVHRSGGRL